MPNSESVTWLNFITDRRNQAIDPAILPFDGLESMLDSIKNPLLQYCVPCIYLLNYSTGKYSLFSDNAYTTLGINKEYFEQGGLDYVISQVHKDDLQLFNDYIFPDRLKFLERINPADHPNYIFSINYRLKNSSGKYIAILQRNTYLRSDAEGKPLLCLGMLLNLDQENNPD